MPTPHKDSKGFYRTLMLEQDASEEQIQLAYEMLCEMSASQPHISKGQVERAYSVLINRSSRAAYDRLELTPVKKKRQWIRLNDKRLLAACVVLLVAILGLVWVPLYGSRFRSFEAGDQLVDLGGRTFGVVVESEERHAFPGGEAAPAYLVELSSTRELRWYPATDLQAACRRSD